MKLIVIVAALWSSVALGQADKIDWARVTSVAPVMMPVGARSHGTLYLWVAVYNGITVSGTSHREVKVGEVVKVRVITSVTPASVAGW